MTSWVMKIDNARSFVWNYHTSTGYYNPIMVTGHVIAEDGTNGPCDGIKRNLAVVNIKSSHILNFSFIPEVA